MRRSATLIGVITLTVIFIFSLCRVPLKSDVDNCTKYVMSQLKDGVDAYNLHMKTVQQMFSNENKRLWLKMENIIELLSNKRKIVEIGKIILHLYF